MYQEGDEAVGIEDSEECRTDGPHGQSRPKDSSSDVHDEALHHKEQHRPVPHQEYQYHYAVHRQNVEPILKHATHLSCHFFMTYDILIIVLYILPRFIKNFNALFYFLTKYINYLYHFM